MTGGWEPPRLIQHPAGFAIRVTDDTTVFGRDLATVIKNYKRMTGRDVVLVAMCEECKREHAE